MFVQASLKVLPNSYINREGDYNYVDEALKIIKASNLYYIIGASETTVEGHRDDVMDLVKQIQDYYYERDINNVMFITFEYNTEKFYINNKKENISKI